MKSSSVALALQILQGLLTPVIAVIAVYIAWQQWKVNERKLKFDQYERRLRVYQEVLTILTHLHAGEPDLMMLHSFRAATAEADFLFKPEISSYIDEIATRGWNLYSAHSEYRAFNQIRPPGYDHQKVVDTMQELQSWFSAQQRADATQKFKKYLDVIR